MSEAMLYQDQAPAPEVRTDKPPTVSTIRPKQKLSTDPDLARGQRAIQQVITRIEAWSGGEVRRGK